MGDYSQRIRSRNSDGTAKWSTAEDHANEAAVDRLIERWAKCTVHPFPPLYPIDRYAERDGRLVAHIEIKTRNHDSGRHPTVWLNSRKYFALLFAYTFQHIPGLFVVQFTDAVKYVDVSRIKPSLLIMGGTTRRAVAGISDREPMLAIPVDRMHNITQ